MTEPGFTRPLPRFTCSSKSRTGARPSSRPPRLGPGWVIFQVWSVPSLSRLLMASSVPPAGAGGGGAMLLFPRRLTAGVAHGDETSGL